MSLVTRITQAVTVIGADIKALTTALTGKVNKTGDSVAGKLTVNQMSQRATMFATQTLEDVSGFLSLNIGSYSYFDITYVNNVGLGISNAPTLDNETLQFTTRFTSASDTAAIDWFGTIVWLTPGEVIPEILNENQIIEVEFTTNNGTLFYARVKAKT